MLSKQQIEFLNSTYSKDKLQADWFPLVKKFVFANRDVQFEGVKFAELAELIESKNSLNKQDLMLVCFAVLLDETIFKKFIASLPPYVPKIIERLLWEDNMGKLEAEEITGKELLLEQGSSYYSNSYKTLPGLSILHVSIQNKGFYSFVQRPWKERYKELDVFLSIPPALKNVIINFYPKPEGYNIKPITAPEQHPDIKIFDVEATIAPEVLRSVAYYQQNNIKYSTKGKPNPVGMNKMQRQLGIAEFFTNKDFSTTRTLMIAGLLYGYKSKHMLVDAVAVIKKLFTENYVNASHHFAPVAPYILTQVKGINYADEQDYKSSANNNILELLKALPVDQWVTTENLVIYIKTHLIDIRPIADWKINNSIYYESERNQRRYITLNNVSRIIDLPYFKGNLFLFAAFGLLSISYTETDTSGEHGKDWYSEYDGLQAVKLTRLGAYILGLEKEYKPTNSEPAGKLVFDENALLVRAEGDTQLVDMLIGNYLEKLSATRYAFNAASFLKDCYAADDIKNKIAIFKQAAGTPLPPLWEAHLQSLVSNTKAINKHDDIVVFQLSSTNKDLQQLVVQDPVIKKLVLKAELFHILVSKDNLSKFKSRMKELGYLV
jgi:hypothetical protein